MKRLTTCLIVVLCVSLLTAASAGKQKKLSERFKKWLDEEVVYIITDLEKDVFFQLETDRERDLFIEAFWKQRDPSPGSPQNEFKEEHYRRINYTNHFFGRTTPKAGWKTDRGEIYIILGEPNDITRFEGKSQIYNTEVWFYQDMTKYGLPPGFNLVFFQQGGSGEYRLYSPLRDGPQALLTSYFGDTVDYMAAYKELRDFEPQLAEVSLSLIPGESSLAMGRPSLSSDLLIQRVYTTPAREIKERYAQKFLDFKDTVEVEYSTNYIDNDSVIKITKDPSGIYFVHYAIEPARLSVNQFEDKYYTTLKLNGTITDPKGEVIFQFEKDISMEFDQERIVEVNRRPLSIRDMFPLIPGTYKMSLLVKNTVSKEFTSLERDLLIPGEQESLQMTSFLMGYDVNVRPPEQNKLRPFQIGTNQIYFQANRTFLTTDSLVLAFQIHGLTQEQKNGAVLRYLFLKDGEPFKEMEKAVGSYGSLPNFIERFSLQEFSPAHYNIELSLLLDGREILQEADEFDVTYQAAIARPWIYSKLIPGTDNPIYAYMMGTQLFNSGKIEQARICMEDAYRKNPDSPEFVLNLARIYMTLEDFKQAETILEPLFDNPEPPAYEVHFLLGKAYQNLGRMDKAIEKFDQTIERYGVNSNLLNSVGECYFQLGRLEEALVVWEKSLEINPEQPDLQKSIAAIKEKNND
ncbi:MAG: GWxTD domain-containing protein [Candidatus Aminicenantes bacterium]|nr:GWxTD domain-containing protein [Candidatus Aminicenantes bacterium]